MDTNRPAKTNTASGPVPAETKITLIAAVAAVDVVAIAVFHDPTTEDNQPEISDGDTQQQPGDPVAVSQPGCLEVKATGFHIAEHGFYPGPTAVQVNRAALVQPTSQQSQIPSTGGPFFGQPLLNLAQETRIKLKTGKHV